MLVLRAWVASLWLLVSLSGCTRRGEATPEPAPASAPAADASQGDASLPVVGRNPTPPCHVEEPPATCDFGRELAFCTHSEACGPEGSRYYTCSQDGAWVESDSSPDCQFMGYDFAYGCVTSERDGFDKISEVVCGMGPGTPCAADLSPVCADRSSLHFCIHGRLSAHSCEEGCMMAPYKRGVGPYVGACAEVGGEAMCACCPQSDPECASPTPLRDLADWGPR